MRPERTRTWVHGWFSGMLACWDAGADCAITSSRVPHTTDPSVDLSGCVSRVFSFAAPFWLHFGVLLRLPVSGEQIRCIEKVSVTLPALCPPHSFFYCLYQQDLPSCRLSPFFILLTSFFVIYSLRSLTWGSFLTRSISIFSLSLIWHFCRTTSHSIKHPSNKHSRQTFG